MPDAPLRMTVALTGSGDPVVVEVLVVTLRDGTLGFTHTDPAVESRLAGAHVTLTDRATGRATAGTSRVVRSGTAYEEVRGRTRAALGSWGRWRHRHDHSVVLVAPELG